MRKVTPKRYAIALYESLREAPREKIPVLVRGFCQLVIRHGALKKIDKIISAFDAYADEQEQRVAVSVSTARPLEPATRTHIMQKLETILHMRIDMQESVDPSLVGGVVLRYGDTIVDGSIRKRLELLASTLQ